MNAERTARPQNLAVGTSHGHPPSERLSPVINTDSTPPIQLLPVEILIKILGLAIEPQQWSLARMRDLAGVCRRWNSVIRSHPTLWAVINEGTSVKDTEVAIRKAKAHPLSLIYRHVGGPLRWRNLLAILASTSPQLWSIDIKPSSHRLEEDWGTIARLTSQVTHFRVHAYWRSPDPAHLSLPQGRQLQLLDISDILLDWSHPRLSGLVILRLDCVPIACSQMMRMLRSSPTLEEVTLSSIRLREISEAQPGCNDRISLPSLRSFHLISVDDCFNQVLPLLHAPVYATIRFEDVDIRALTLGNDPVIFRIIPPVLPSVPSIGVRVTSRGLSLVARNTPAKRIRHNIHGQFGGVALLGPLQIGCCGPFVTRLDVDMRNQLDQYPVESLGRLCNLEALRVHGGAWVEEVLNFLSRPVSSEGEHGAWPCPKLKSLDVGFRAHRKRGWMGSRFTPDDGSTLQNLISSRWGGHDSVNVTDLTRARLDSLTIWVPEDLGGEEELDALASFACRGSKILGNTVLRIVSTTPG